MVHCAKILVRYHYILHGHQNFLFGFDQKKRFFGGSCRNITIFGVRAESPVGPVGTVDPVGTVGTVETVGTVGPVGPVALVLLILQFWLTLLAVLVN